MCTHRASFESPLPAGGWGKASFWTVAVRLRCCSVSIEGGTGLRRAVPGGASPHSTSPLLPRYTSVVAWFVDGARMGGPYTAGGSINVEFHHTSGALAS